MLFHTFDYFVLLAAVLAVYWWLPLRKQNLLLLAASYLFYGYIHPWYCILIALTSTVDFTCARAISKQPEKKKLWFGISLLTNFSILVALKYFNFFTDNFIAVAGMLGFQMESPLWRVLLPVGISFYTFQSCSYVFDVYRGEIAARRRFPDYLLFVSFFPQLVAGPIERAAHLLSQVETRRRFNASDFRDGLFLILWGLVKKRVIADTSAVYANKLFALNDASLPLVWAGAFVFAIQIYADFSAYSDIARGSARLLGFDLMHNFRHPYLATSPADFWRRWHISLSTWFRDYVYIPLGGSRCSPARTAFNLFLTFLLSGLWHGAAWNFVLWGAWHGIALIAWKHLDAALPGFTRSTSHAAHFTRWSATLFVVLAGWLMFREHSFPQLLRHFTSSPFSAPSSDWLVALYLCLLNLIYALPLIVHAVFEPRLTHWHSFRETGKGFLLQTAIASLLFCMLLTLSSSVGSDFIYFQF